MKVPIIYAHRGGRVWAPENTLCAFGKSVTCGYSIELDVHRCKTGELVILHDGDLKATTNGGGLVSQTTLTDLRKLSAGAHFGNGIDFAAERVPLLSEVLSLVAGKVMLNIEVKNAPVEYPGIEHDLVSALGGYPSATVVVSSFDHDLLKRLSVRAPQYKLALLVNGLIAGLPAYARSLGAEVWHPMFVNLRADSVAAAQTAGLTVNAWTLNGDADWAAGVAMGLDGIVTDDPEGLDRFLKAAAGTP